MDKVRIRCHSIERLFSHRFLRKYFFPPKPPPIIAKNSGARQNFSKLKMSTRKNCRISTAVLSTWFLERFSKFKNICTGMRATGCDGVPWQRTSREKSYFLKYHFYLVGSHNNQMETDFDNIGRQQNVFKWYNDVDKNCCEQLKFLF